MERAAPLFFFFGSTNYCRWTPLFLQDCYQLKEKFPLLYDSFMHGEFVVNTTKKGSGVPFDQALEQCYKRTAKVSRGIIGVTRKKEAVALWGIKHKKDQYVDLLKMKDDVEGELSLHHDFNPSTATKIVRMVQDSGVSPEGMQYSTRPGSAEECSHWRNCDQRKHRQVVVLLVLNLSMSDSEIGRYRYTQLLAKSSLRLPK